MKNVFKELLKFLINRYFIMFIITSLAFCVLIARFFELQIVLHDDYTSEINTKIQRPVPIKASRGIILDRYGRDLAVNKSIYVVEIEPSMFDGKGRPLIATEDASRQRLADESLGIKNLNDVLLELINLLHENNSEFIDLMPISKTAPFQYTEPVSETKIRRYIKDVLGNESLEDDENEWIKADEFIKRLRVYFSIPKDWSDNDARNVLSILAYMKMNRYLQYQPITIAKDVNYNVVVSIEESETDYYGVHIESEALREYPDGIYFSNLIGYTGKINEEKYEELIKLGYSRDDIIGVQGLEESFEEYLHGEDGSMLVEVNYYNRKVGFISEEDPIPGDKVFLTIDKDLQIATYDIVVENLKKILLSKMNGGATNGKDYTEIDVLSSMIYTNNLSIYDVFESEEDTASHNVLEYIKSKNSELDIYIDKDFNEARGILSDGILDKNINATTIINVLYEQGFFKDDDEDIQKVFTGAMGVRSFLIEKINNDELTPAQIGLEPLSASVLVLDVNTGDTLAAVGYPNFDNNLFANSVDASYLKKLTKDKSAPFVNRPYSELLAPGSTFKMITAIAGLESDTINPGTTIYDKVTFLEASWPYPTCMSRLGHGSIDVATALEVSCNYFFYETSFKLGANIGDRTNGIDILNKYMIEFGLNDKSGVELYESQAGLGDSLNISSPSLREAKNEGKWEDGSTVRTAIGQDMNAYSPAVMAKYFATLATKGVRYQSHLLKKIETANGEIVKEFTPVIEKEIVLKDSTWDEVIDGMKRVVSGDRGTATRAFSELPIEVAGKTGTAELTSNRASHTTFGGFAPANSPEIAVYVSIPNGDYSGGFAPSSEVARDVINAYMGLDEEVQLPTKPNSLVE